MVESVLTFSRVDLTRARVARLEDTLHVTLRVAMIECPGLDINILPSFSFRFNRNDKQKRENLITRSSVKTFIDK